MKLRVLLFAAARQAAGRESLEVELPPSSDVAALRRALAAACPALQPLLGQSRFAVNRQYAQDSRPLVEGDEIACIPPVSGG